MEQLSSSVTISAGYLNSTFPFHTEPKYEITGGFVDGMGGIMSAAFAPFVREEQRKDWYEVAWFCWNRVCRINLAKIHILCTVSCVKGGSILVRTKAGSKNLP